MTLLLNALRPSANFSAFGELVSLLGRHRALTIEMARREITERYSGQMFGAVWAIGHPLFLMAVFVFVFAFVFKTKLGGTYEMPLDYTAYILSGLIPWMAFQEAMNKACVVIKGSEALVKQVVFPVEVLPVKGVLAAVVTQLISTTVLLIYIIAAHRMVHWTYILLPVLLVIQVLAMIGVAYFLSAIAVFFRDMKDIVQLFGIAGMYLMPIFYLPKWVPAIFKPVLYLNPFSYLVWCYQDILYYGRFEHPLAWAVVLVLSLGTFILGFRFFRRLKTLFGNVL